MFIYISLYILWKPAIKTIIIVIIIINIIIIIIITDGSSVFLFLSSFHMSFPYFV